MDEIDKLRENVEKLRKNEDLVPKNELLGKYRLSYMKLKKEIGALADQIFFSEMLAGKCFLKNDDARFRQFMKEANDFYLNDKLKNNDSFARRRADSLFRDKDVNGYLKICGEFSHEIDRFYLPYWNSKTWIREGWIYNEIEDMIWIGACWYDWKAYPKQIHFSYSYPPPDGLLKTPHKNADGEMVTC